MQRNRSPPGILEPFKPYLRERWNAGCTNAAALFSEITARGYRGDQNVVRQHLRQFRTTADIPARPPRPPSVRRVVSWTMTDPPNMDPADQR